MDEDIGIGVAVLLPAHVVDHTQLDREITQVHERASQHEAEHEDDHARRRVEHGVEGAAQREEQQTRREDRHAVTRRGETAQQVEQHGRHQRTDRLQRPERRLVAHERHHEHRGRRDDVALRDALQHGQPHHLVPQPVEAEVNEPLPGRAGETAAADHRRGDDRQHEDEHRHQLVGEVDIAREPAVIGRRAQKRADHARHDDAGHRIEEALQTVIVVAVTVVRRTQGQEVAVGPEEAVGEAHDKPRDDDSAQRERLERHHHGHRHAAEQHAERIEVRDPDVPHQESVEKERKGNARIDGQLVTHDVGQLRTVAHDIRADEKLHDGQHECVEHVRQEQDPHVERVGAEVSDFRKGPAEDTAFRACDGRFFHVSSW